VYRVLRLSACGACRNITSLILKNEEVFHVLISSILIYFILSLTLVVQLIVVLRVLASSH
jgi:hypothetical protein